MGTEENKAIYRRFVEEVVNQGEFDVVDQLYSPSYADHNAPPGAPAGLAGVKAIMGMFRTAFPDVHFTIDEMVAEGDLVATRVTGHGTNNGSFMGAPPSGKVATWSSKGVFRVVDGQIIEHWGSPDMLSLLRQIGMLPPKAQLPTPEAPQGARPDYTPVDPHDPDLLRRNKAVVLRVYEEGFTQGDVESCVEYVAQDFVDHPPARFFNVPLVGPESLAGAIREFRDGFPDRIDVIQDLIAEGTRVVANTLWRGTHNGTFVGVPPTGKAVTVTGISFFRIGEDGMIVERFGSFDALGLMQQIGLVPSPEPEAARQR